MFLFLVSFLTVSDAFVATVHSKQSTLDLKRAFDYWKTTYGKTYPTIVEEDKRFSIFIHNYHFVHNYNAQPHQTAVLDLNQFADLTSDEFNTKHSFPRPPSRQYRRNQQPLIVIRREDELVPRHDRVFTPLPSSVDWSNVTKPIMNDGECGASWASAAVHAIQARWAIKSGRLDQLSIQQVIDCDKSNTSDGCNGGFMDSAYRYVKKNGGLCTAEDYPYKGKDQQCQASKCKPIDPISGYVDVPKNNARAMMEALVSGPVSTAVEGTQPIFQFYHSGVITGDCGARVDSGILIVGYGTENGQDYWKLQNSWGSVWGDRGFVKLCRNCNKNNGAGQCGLLETGSYPTI